MHLCLLTLFVLQTEWSTALVCFMDSLLTFFQLCVVQSRRFGITVNDELKSTYKFLVAFRIKTVSEVLWTSEPEIFSPVEGKQPRIEETAS
jgi:hypothetical protein